MSTPPTRYRPGRRSRRRTRRTLPACLVGAFALTSPQALIAQAEQPPGGHQKWLFGAIGGLVVGLPAYLSADFGVGSCNARNCFAPIAATVGAVTGFLIGLERDNASARRWVAGPEVKLVARAFDVPLAADDLAPIPEGGIALLGEAGLARASAEAGVTSTHAARGVLAAVVLREYDALLAASATDLLAFDRDESVRGARRVFDSGGSALAVVGGGGVVVGGEGTLRRLAATGSGRELELTEQVAATEPRPARSLVWSGTVLWTLAGDRVVARSAETLAEVGAAPLGAPGRSLAMSGAVGAVASGESGVAILDLSDPRMPSVASRYVGVRYAYDVEVVGTTAFVTAGEQGLVRLDLTDPSTPVVTAVVGNLGQPYAVVRSGKDLYVLDRDDRRLHVLDVSDEETPPR